MEHSVEYREYLKSAAWKQRRWDAIQRANMRCQCCGVSMKKVVLEVHHVTYERLGNESPQDLLAVCPSCHKKEDEKRRVQTMIRQEAAEEDFQERRMSAWAAKVYGERWHYMDPLQIEEEFEEFLERIDGDTY